MNRATFKKIYTQYIPLVVPLVLVVLQALVDNGVWNVSAHDLILIDAILGALGLHSLHLRTK